MLYHGRAWRSGIFALVVLSVLTACGGSSGSSSSELAGSGSGSASGGGSGSDSGGGDTLPAAIEGVATPSSVAVVTATNAQ